VKSHPFPPHRHPSLTPHQQAVLDVLSQQAEPLSAQDLYAILRQHRSIGLATVYRSLETLKLQGLLQSRVGRTGESRYSPIAEDCHYLTCLQCSQSFPLDYCPVGYLATHSPPSGAFKIYYHTLEFFGLCGVCDAQSSD
jgi:Fur family transcriptional regulator, ferric uptake regulator